ncbi:MAG: serine/threonine protein kinase [Planctomycetes bacterium]|nr:serine/threonine protein kinase [Planctomycetota bacterium]
MQFDDSHVSLKDCPDVERLQAFSLGCLSNEDLQAIADHASGCSHCEAALATLEQHSDTLVSNLRRHVPLSGTRAFGEGSQGAADKSATATVGSTVDTTVYSAAGAKAKAKRPAPDRVLHFELTEFLGEGGMGTVYKAFDTKVKRTVALKLGPVGKDSGQARARFDVEAEAVARLDHPNIVRLFHAGDFEGRQFFAMDYIDGGSLADALKAGPLPERKAAELLRVLAYAMQHAHDQKIVHRDLKPANVLLTSDGTPKIADFGLAKMLDSDSGHTRDNAVLGTYRYMAPEVAAGKTKQSDQLVDVYGLGAVLYEVLTGAPPFKCKTENETRALVLKQQPKPPKEIRPEISEYMNEACMKCLEKKPKMRVRSAQALGDDLGRWLRGEPTEIRPPGRVMRIILWSRRRPALAAGIFAAMLAIAALPVVLYYSDPDYKIKQIERRLARGEKVVLIGETGSPSWIRWQNHENKSQTSLSGTGEFTVHSLGYGVIELVRDPKWVRYRYLAELKYHTGMKTSQAGVAFAIVTSDLEAKRLLSFGQLAFNDTWDAQEPLQDWPKDVPPPNAPHAGNPVTLSTHMIIQGPDGTHVLDQEDAVRVAYLFQAAVAERPRPWRQLQVEVSPKGVSTTWAGNVQIQPVPTLQWSNSLAMGVDSLNKRGFMLGNALSELRVRGALGLYVQEGSVSFRNVVVEPLDDDP